MIIKTKQPDARIVGGLFAYILPEHVWGKQSVKSHRDVQAAVPIVGSGPTWSREFDRGRIIRMTRNKYFRAKPKFDEVQWIKYGTNDAVERALTLGEIDIVPEVQDGAYARLDKAKDVKGVSRPRPRSRS